MVVFENYHRATITQIINLARLVSETSCGISPQIWENLQKAHTMSWAVHASSSQLREVAPAVVVPVSQIRKLKLVGGRTEIQPELSLLLEGPQPPTGTGRDPKVAPSTGQPGLGCRELQWEEMGGRGSNLWGGHRVVRRPHCRQQRLCLRPFAVRVTTFWTGPRFIVLMPHPTPLIQAQVPCFALKSKDS